MNDRQEIVEAALTVSIHNINEEKITNYKFSAFCTIRVPELIAYVSCMQKRQRKQESATAGYCAKRKIRYGPDMAARVCGIA